MTGTTSSTWDDDDNRDPWESPSEVGANDSATDGGVYESQAMLFTVANPRDTVSVTALADGRPIRVELAPEVADMTESQLGEEILVIARLATRNAKAGQHLVASAVLQRLGHDRTATLGYLERELGLPSPETVLADKARMFATRYADDDFST